MDEQQRDALLIRLDERTSRIAHLIEGNGHPGMLHDVTVLKEDMRQREREADELRSAVGTKGRVDLVKNGGLTLLLITIFTAIKAVFFPNQ